MKLAIPSPARIFAFLFRREAEWRERVSLWRGAHMRRWREAKWEYRELTREESADWEQRQAW